MTPDRDTLARTELQRHALDHLVAIHHLAWITAHDADEAGVRGSRPVEACREIADLADHWHPCPEDPAIYLRAAIDLLHLASNEAPEVEAPLDALYTLLEAHDG